MHRPPRFVVHVRPAAAPARGFTLVETLIAVGIAASSRASPTPRSKASSCAPAAAMRSSR